MKKVFSILVVTTALSLSSSAVLPAGAYSYKNGLVENFNSMGTAGTNAPKLNGQSLWTMELYAEGADVAANLTVASARAGGYSSAGFNAAATNNTDRSLAIGKSITAYFTTKFVNDTANKLTEIELYYDLECPFVKGGGSTAAALSAEISTTGTNNWLSLGTNFNANVSYSGALTDTWLTDAQMDAQKLSKRNVGGIIALPAAIGSIQTGQVFYIRWVAAQDPSAKMTCGIDNLRSGTDSDNDGLSNVKETSLGTNPNVADSDGDGMSDGDEFAYGTDPLDTTSLFAVKLEVIPAPTLTGIGTNTVSCPAADGKYYTLLFSESMTGTFTPVTDCIRKSGQKGTRMLLNHATENDIGFYKLRIE